MTTQSMLIPASHAARSDVGVARDHNEDRLLARPPLFVVADGLGGHSAGEVAAQLLVDRLAELPPIPTGIDLVLAIEDADRAIRAASAQDVGRHGMSTTCVALLIGDAGAQLSHVGDSRAYRLRSGALERLTEDHSVVGELVRNGIITEAQAEVDERRHILTQALGTDRPASVTTTPVDVQVGDRYLLCSDGLSGQVPDATIRAVMSEHGDPGLAADELVRLANAAGGADNVTVIVVDPQVSVAIAASAGAAPAAQAPPAAGGRRGRRGLLLAAGAAGAVIVVLGATTLFGGTAPSATPAPTSMPLVTSSPTATPASTVLPAGSSSPLPSDLPDGSVDPIQPGEPPGSVAPDGSVPPGGPP